jgi:hypothetical protein
MATTTVQTATETPVLQNVETFTSDAVPQKHHVQTILNYYADPGDGSPPAPTYVGYVLLLHEAFF